THDHCVKLHYRFFLIHYTHHRLRPSFPTRRSSDLHFQNSSPPPTSSMRAMHCPRNISPARTTRTTSPSAPCTSSPPAATATSFPDRKSTRLNSSHGSISYAVFCLKKKTTNKNTKNQ